MTRAQFLSLSLSAALLAGASRARAQDEHTVVVDPASEPAPPSAEPPRPAEALPEEPSLVHFELLARGGYMTPAVHGGITPFGLGAGGGIGLAIGHVYLGGGIIAYSGGRDATGSSEHSLLYGIETGYELRVPAAAFTLRPFVGAGGATITHSIPITAPANGPVSVAVKPPDVITQATGGSGGGGGSAATTSDSVVNAIYVEPGVLAMFMAPSGLFAGLRASVLYFPSVSYGADGSAKWLPYAFHLTLGDRF